MENGKFISGILGLAMCQVLQLIENFTILSQITAFVNSAIFKMKRVRISGSMKMVLPF